MDLNWSTTQMYTIENLTVFPKSTMAEIDILKFTYPHFKATHRPNTNRDQGTNAFIYMIF